MSSVGGWDLKMNSSRRLGVLTTHSEKMRVLAPRRHLDGHDLPNGSELLVGRWFEDDLEVQTAFHEKVPGPIMRMMKEMRWLVSQRRRLVQFSHVYCLEGIHFNLLMVLARTPVFRPKGKSIRRFAFRDRALERMAPLLRRSDVGFQVDYITMEQVERARARVGEERVLLHPWKVDVEWYRPSEGKMPTGLKGRVLLPGNMFRCESLVDPLLESGVSVCRMGRHGKLKERFAHLQEHQGFELVINAPHVKYLEALRASEAVLLPIEDCDEPAGLTAAMEAVACGRPVLANRSMGIAELFGECEYPLPMVDGLRAGEWIRAITDLRRLAGEVEFLDRLRLSMMRLRERRGILPRAGDWVETLGWKEEA